MQTLAMAKIKALTYKPALNARAHTECLGTYSIGSENNGARFIQIDTYGTEARQMAGKQSQSIRLHREEAMILANEILRVFKGVEGA